MDQRTSIQAARNDHRQIRYSGLRIHGAGRLGLFVAMTFAALLPTSVILADRVAGTVPAGASSQPTADLDAGMQHNLALIVAQWKAENYPGAALDVSRLVSTANDVQREQLSRICKRDTGLTLADLAAEIHFRTALAARRGAAVRFKYITEYEKLALTARIEAAYRAALTTPVSPAQAIPAPSTAAPAESASRRERADIASLRSRPAASQPATSNAPPPASQPSYFGTSQPALAHKRYIIADYLDRPNEMQPNADMAEAILERIYHAVSLLNERLRLDPQLRRNRALRSDLLKQKHRLSTLADALRDRLDAPSRPKPDSTAAELERMRQTYFLDQMRNQQREDVLRMREAVDAARKLDEQSPTHAAGGALLGGATSPPPAPTQQLKPPAVPSPAPAPAPPPVPPPQPSPPPADSDSGQ